LISPIVLDGLSGPLMGRGDLGVRTPFFASMPPVAKLLCRLFVVSVSVKYIEHC